MQNPLNDASVASIRPGQILSWILALRHMFKQNRYTLLIFSLQRLNWFVHDFLDTVVLLLFAK